ncbi:hypothetical protein MJO28_005266 [Puccinia striiformis f. sp. tritici]|uniref:Uncharacterized protein n=1 Tax=Puccinia striiformis f. sp. tritici TaxID=168172 RepID=A0ACC0EN67_9BASI|nr:hypothetical protein MJO28_005266 [Puccinia striiformis f. sp. tritici]
MTAAASEPSDLDEEEVLDPSKETLTHAAKHRRAANLGAPRNEHGAQKGGGTQKKGCGTQKKGSGTQKKGSGTQKKVGTRKNGAQNRGGTGFKGPWRPK